MKLDLQPTTYSIKGYSKLYGVHHSRIKAVSKKVNDNTSNNAVHEIRRSGQQHIKEYRLVKEAEGFIFREVLLDSGISGHHKTVKEAIASALRFVSIHIDEEYNHTHFPEFMKLKKEHEIRQSGKCKHEHLDPISYRCLECGLHFHPDADK